MHLPRICESCGQSYLPHYNVSQAGFAKRKYCSDACRYEASRGRSNPKNSGPRRPLPEQFWEKVDIGGPDECWLWRGALGPNGYGRLMRVGRGLLAHRVAYELTTGPIPQGLCVLHACDVRPCVNPQHLWLGTIADNNIDRHRKGRNADQRGARSKTAKLTDGQVAAIRERHAAGESQSALAREFGIVQPHVSRIVRGTSW